MATVRSQARSSSIHEIIALAIFLAGTLLLLALISYSPADLSIFSPTDRLNKTTQNFVGSFGALIAGLCYVSLGAASYLLAATMIGYGATGVFGRALGFSMRPVWALLFVFSGACLLHVLDWQIIDLRSINIDAHGGWVGKSAGSALRSLFGPAVVLILGSAYAVTLALMVGLHPLRVARRIFALLGKWKKARQMDQSERENEEQLLLLEQKKIERERKRIEREISKQRGKKTALAEQGELPSLEKNPSDENTDEPNRPEPKIIDSALPATPTPARKKDKEKHQLLAAIHSENYQFPDFDLLDPIDTDRRVASHDELFGVQNRIIETLAEFGILVTAGDITKGPTITRYEVYPAKGVRVDRIASYERDLARSTRAERINILAPIPGKDTVGIEIANSHKQKVTLRELLESDEFQNAKGRIPIALGKDVYGHTIIADLAAMPHGLVAGTTGSGKSVCINAILASILYRFSPEDLRLIMIDPKVVEMQIYNTLPHLVVPVVTDPKKTLLALKWAVNEMEKRYAIFAKVGVRNIAGFNSRPAPRSQKELDAANHAQPKKPERVEKIMMDPDEEPDIASSSDILGKPFGEQEEDVVINAHSELYGTPTGEPETHELDRAEQAELGIHVPRDDGISVPEKMPFIVVIVDELADLMQTAPADVELLIARITQKARAAGIHMVIATQTPRADVITGVIKANVPCRIAFQVASPLDSRVILDENGAERLLGQGDLLYRPPGTSKLVRAQGVLVTDEEVHRIVEFVSRQSEQCFESEIHEKLNATNDDGEEEISEEDEDLVEKCLEVMREERKASTSLFQRRLRLGYTRAARILDILESRGYVGPGDGAKPREILRQ